MGSRRMQLADKDFPALLMASSKAYTYLLLVRPASFLTLLLARSPEFLSCCIHLADVSLSKQPVRGAAY
jgi:hypothetical protein